MRAFMIIGAIFGAIVGFNQTPTPEAGVVVLNAFWGTGLGYALNQFFVNLSVVWEVAKIFVVAIIYLMISALYVLARWDALVG